MRACMNAAQVHLTSIILSVALLAEGLEHANSNSLNNDGTALVLSTILLTSGVITVLWLSLSSIKPFENHGLVLATMLFCFLGALALKIFAFSTVGSTLSSDHNARVVALLGFMSEAAGISLVPSRHSNQNTNTLSLPSLCPRCQIFAAFVTGLAASNRPYDADLKSTMATGTPMVSNTMMHGNN